MAESVEDGRLLHADHAIVLWLVPSNTILDQTADALRDPRHPYRRALELSCGAVEVLTIEEALALPRAAVVGQTVVIVSTIQCFRATNTTGRKVYGQNGVFAEHLLNVPADQLADLVPGADGRPIPSLVNMLRLRRPIVIVDEAHNARSDLSFSTLGDLRPSCIVEFTATPARKGHPSNVLHRVSAAELKAADMVKLPLRVVTRHPSQKEQLLAEAVSLRADLERIAAGEAQRTGEYLRPILLIQAESVDACEPLKERLASDFGLTKEAVKISVGKRDELKEIKDIRAPSCPVRVIITVEKLREGWDCPFAYVLCSLKETRSATAIEQIVGRILRLPGARSKEHPDLNCAYAFSLSVSIHEVLAELKEALEQNGFTAAEAERIIIPVSAGTLPLGVQPRMVTFEPGREIDLGMAAAKAADLSGKVRFDAAMGAITVFVPLAAGETETLSESLRTPEAKLRLREAVEAVRAAEMAFGGSGETRAASPYEQQQDFLVPKLAIREGGDLFELESTCLIDRPWRLSELDASIPGYDPLTKPPGKAGVVDVGSNGAVVTSAEAGDFVATLHQQVLALGTAGGWTMEELIVWLDRHIDHRDIPLSESAEFIRRSIRGVLARFERADVDALALDRFRMREAIETRIAEHRLAQRQAAFQQLLIPGAPLSVTDELAVDFKSMRYEPSWSYDGSFQFKNHYFGSKPGELREKTPAGKPTEEFRCAQYLDGLSEIEFWVRNLARKSSSFRLQTSQDWFYPDFVCRLRDGRILVVEYKGGHLYGAADAEEKRAVGAVWESRSGGRCLFVMPSGGDFEVIARKVAST